MVFEGTGLRATDVGLTRNTAYTYELEAWTGSAYGPVSSSTTRTTIDSDNTDGYVCASDVGFIDQGDYSNNAAKTWLIQPSSSFAGLYVNVSVHNGPGFS